MYNLAALLPETHQCLQGLLSGFAADLGFKEIHVKALPGDVMAGAGGGGLVQRGTYGTNSQVKQYCYTLTKM